MASRIENQISFSTILFDSLFGLILFFSLDSFLEIKNSLHFFFYLFGMFILVHWWLIFKSADDAFKTEVTDSAVDIVFGIIYLILIEYIILMAKGAEYLQALYFLIALLAVDFVWAVVWRYVGKWHTKDSDRMKRMEKELNTNIGLDGVFLLIFILLAAVASFLTDTQLVLSLVISYVIYLVLTFKYKIIDIEIF